MWGRPPQHGKRASIYRNGFVTGRPLNFSNSLKRWQGLVSMNLSFRRYGLSSSQVLSLSSLRHHSPVSEAREALPDSFWSRATKIAVVRDPLDRAISYFYWMNPQLRGHRTPLREFEDFVPEILPAPVDREVSENFDESWKVIRFENLHQDFCSLVEQLGFTPPPDLPRYKSESRPPHSDFRKLISQRSREVILRNWSSWAKSFGYSDVLDT